LISAARLYGGFFFNVSFEMDSLCHSAESHDVKATNLIEDLIGIFPDEGIISAIVWKEK
jgi:hypothetical protein